MVWEVSSARDGGERRPNARRSFSLLPWSTRLWACCASSFSPLTFGIFFASFFSPRSPPRRAHAQWMPVRSYFKPAALTLTRPRVNVLELRRSRHEFPRSALRGLDGHSAASVRLVDFCATFVQCQ